MLITRTSPFSGKVHTRDIDVTPEQLDAWEKGARIDRVMSNLSADDREFIMTGITPMEWDAAFGDEENA